MARAGQTNPEGAVTVKESSNPHDPSAHAPAVTVPNVGQVQPAGVNSLLPIVARGRPVTPQQMQGGAGGMPNDEMSRAAETRIVGEQGNVVGSAVGTVAPTQSAQKVKEPTRYRVVNGGRIMLGGALTVLRPGKELDERQYDLRELKKQGIRLEEVKEDDENTFAEHDPLVDQDPLLNRPNG
jgi:hypothetical protein